MTAKKRRWFWWRVQTNVESTKLKSSSLNFIWKWGSFDVLIILLFSVRFFSSLSASISSRLFHAKKTKKKRSRKIMTDGFSKRWFRYNQVIIFHAVPLFPIRALCLYAFFMRKTFYFCVLKQWMTREYFVCCFIFIHYFFTLGMGVMCSWSMINNATRSNGCINKSKRRGTMNVNESKNWKVFLTKHGTFINLDTGVWYHLIPNK